MNRFLRLLVKKQLVIVSFLLTLMLSGGFSMAQTTYLWTGSSTTWTNTGTWTPSGTYPGGTTGISTDVGQFGSAAGATLGINMNTTFASGGTQNLSIGGIQVTSARTAAFTINNNSTSRAGVLTLNGATINGVSNTILSNEAAAANIFNLTTTNPMRIALGGSSNLTINCAVGVTTANGSVINITDTVTGTAPWN